MTKSHDIIHFLGLVDGFFIWDLNGITMGHDYNIPLYNPYHIWLVVYLPFWKMMEWKSVGMIIPFPINDGTVIIHSCSSHHQPVISYSWIPSKPNMKKPLVLCVNQLRNWRWPQGFSKTPSTNRLWLDNRHLEAPRPGWSPGDVTGAGGANRES